MNQMEQIAKMIANEPDPVKKEQMKKEIEIIFYLTQHYGKIPRTQLSRELGLPKYQVNQLIIENGICEPPRAGISNDTGKAAQNRRAYEKRKVATQ